MLTVLVLLVKKSVHVYFLDVAFRASRFEDMYTSSFRALVVAYGWMLPREADMVSE